MANTQQVVVPNSGLVDAQGRPLDSTSPAVCQLVGFCATIFHIVANPFKFGSEAVLQYFKKGLVVVDLNTGKIVAIGNHDFVISNFPGLSVKYFPSGHVIIPAFVQLHLHWAQLLMTWRYGCGLIEWLLKYTIPHELRICTDFEHARRVAQLFLRWLINGGTVVANVFGTHSDEATRQLFTAASELGDRSPLIISGMAVGDRSDIKGLPEQMRHSPEEGAELTRQLIKDWHGANGGRIWVSVISRFAPFSTRRQLKLLGEVFQDHREEGVGFHTHLRETDGEDELNRELHGHDDYLRIYDEAGLVEEGAVFAHCGGCTKRERELIEKRRSSVGFCPGSNMFLGAFLADIFSFLDMDILAGCGTDIGAGPSISPMDDLKNVYLSQMIWQGQKRRWLEKEQRHLPASEKQEFIPKSPPTATEALYLYTLAGAEALHVEDEWGNLLPNKRGSFVVLNTEAVPLLPETLTGNPHDDLFTILDMGGSHMISAVYFDGKPVDTLGRNPSQ